ncbi:predicted protein [Plenodomus lingam JN3]|uniref:Predicted protein n=1 Tax=Leptosphaeria maculans (strain JN3 / isolate v23.1.3 / race Av1-4-5-6-7-8) TaxID=985895 RepID=E4ZRI8_LEPMJ|nr:predicted protein [Plenodomus lingam JN3]CBX93835.1 predicted protein [Plenodomus lingam JN3]
MTFEAVIMKLRRAVLCCSKRERSSPSETVRLEVVSFHTQYLDHPPTSSLAVSPIYMIISDKFEQGSPTDVRRVDVSATLPGLMDAQRRYVREKASSDAVHLLGLQSEPPSHPATSPPSPTQSNTRSIALASNLSSREPSVALLNAASKDLPSVLPTPPKRTHNENSPPASRMKTMWKDSNRPSNSSTCHEGLYEKLEQIKGADVEEKGLTESFVTLNLDFEFADEKSVHASSVHASESTSTLSLTGGFEMQDTKGGRCQPIAKNLVVKNAIDATNLGDSSDENDFEEDSLIAAEHVQLVKI